MMSLPIYTMTETLFGGLIVAAILFFTTRALGLSNFWAGILSGLAPFIAYLFYAKQHWAGGDVLTIHFAVYLANAGLLIAFGGMQKNKQRLHWAPKLIIGFFILLVLLNAIFLSISMRGLPAQFTALFLPKQEADTVHTAFPGVVPHEQNKLYEPVLKQVEMQKKLGWTVDSSSLEHLTQDKPSVIEIVVTDANHQPLTKANITLEMWRMANSLDDQAHVLNETSPGHYRTTMTLHDEGRWVADITIHLGEQQFHQQLQLTVLAANSPASAHP